jgi:hypothetical protein
MHHFVQNTNLRAFDMRGRDARALCAVQTTPEQQRCATLNYLSGCHITDGRTRIFIVEGVSHSNVHAADADVGIAALMRHPALSPLAAAVDDINNNNDVNNNDDDDVRDKANSRHFTVLQNRDVTFAARLFGAWGGWCESLLCDVHSCLKSSLL